MNKQIELKDVNPFHLRLSVSKQAVQSKEEGETVTDFEVQDIRINEEELNELFRTRSQSTNLWENEYENVTGRCKNERYSGMTGVMLDFDEGITIREIKEKCKLYHYILYTSTRHKTLQYDTGELIEKFRIILPFNPRFYNAYPTTADFEKVYAAVGEEFSGMDEKCAKPASKFFPSCGDFGLFEFEIHTGKDYYNPDSGITMLEYSDNNKKKAPLNALSQGVDEGERNDSLARLAGSWLWDGLSLGECIEKAKEVNLLNDPPMSEEEVLSVVKSIHKMHFEGKSGIQVETNTELLSKVKDNEEIYRELLKRAKSLNDMAQNELIDKIRIATGLPKNKIEMSVRKTKIVDYRKPYIINGIIDTLEAAQYIIGQKRIIRFKENFYEYNGSIYELLDKEAMESRIHHEIKERYSNNKVVSEILNAIKREVWVDEKTVEASQSKYIIAVNNGLLDVRTMELEGYTPGDYHFKKMNANYKKDAKCPLFIKFIEALFEGDTDAEEKIKLTQEIFGYLLIPDYIIIKKLFYLYGPLADNGKSSLIEIIRNVIGPEYFESVPMNKMDGFLLKRLYGKQANVVGDQDAHTRVPDGTIKQLVGELDEIVGDVKQKEAIKFINKARLIFSVNRLPYSEAKDAGYFARCVILKFNNRFLVDPDPKKTGNTRQIRKK